MPEDWAFGGAGLIKYLLVFMFVCLFVYFTGGFLKNFSVYFKTLQKIKVGLNDQYLSIYYFM